MDWELFLFWAWSLGNRDDCSGGAMRGDIIFLEGFDCFVLARLLRWHRGSVLGLGWWQHALRGSCRLNSGIYYGDKYRKTTHFSV